MSKQEFMKELESLLADIPLEERIEALRYYDSYFEDAGAEHEDEILKELGSPGKVAKLIKTELLSISEERNNKGYFTEKGYKAADDGEDKFDLVKSSDKSANNEQKEARRQQSSFNQADYNNQNAGNNWNAGNNQNNTGNQYNNQYQSGQSADRNSNKALLIILLICSSFIWAPLLAGLFGVIVGILAAIFGILFGLGVTGFALTVAGIAMFIAGLIKLSVPFIGVLMIGGGLFTFGIGMLISLAFIVICKNVIPAIVKGIVNLCRRPFKNRRVMA